jgi:predicted nucleotidyltransferase
LKTISDSHRYSMFTKLLKTIALALDGKRIPYMIIGGQAVLLHGEPRMTRDIDVTVGISTEEIDQMLDVVESIQLNPLVDPYDFTSRTMVLPCQDPESHIRVDFIFSFSPYERQAMERVRLVDIEGVSVKFASAEDLVIHKVFAGRPRDMEDVKSVLIKNPEMDTRYIRQWLNELAEATGESFADRFENALKDIS